MIRKTWHPNKWLLTTQREHGRVAGLIASSWNFPEAKPHEEVIWAAAHHEDGWIKYDEEPAITKKGEPVSFHESDGTTLVAAWNESIRLAKEAGKHYAARLIAALCADYAQALNLARFSARESLEMGRFIYQTRRVAETNTGHGIDEEVFQRDLAFLHVCDAISMALASDFTGEMPIDTSRIHGRTETLVLVRKRSDTLSGILTPLPFRKNFRDHFHSHMVDQRSFATKEELKEQLLANKPVMNEIHLGA